MKNIITVGLMTLGVLASAWGQSVGLARTETPSLVGSLKIDSLKKKTPFPVDSLKKKRNLEVQRGGGVVNGGGGSVCKLQFMTIAKSLQSLQNESDPSLNQKYLADLIKVFDPEKNPGFRVSIVSKPIQNCPYTENALACARVSKNIVEINCGINGLNSLSLFEQYKHVIHELSWWINEKYDDSNYFYSSGLAEQLKSHVISIQKLNFLTLRKGQVNSVETNFDTVDCFSRGMPSNWVKNVNGSYKCSAKEGCVYMPSFGYTLEINQKYLYTESKLEFMDSKRVPDQTLLTQKECIELARPSFNQVSNQWYQFFDSVNSGAVGVESYEKNGKTCFTQSANISYDSIKGQVGRIDSAKEILTCP